MTPLKAPYIATRLPLSLLLITALCGLPRTASAADPESWSLKPLRAEAWNRTAAAHLLRRAGFGGTPAEIDKLAALGLEAAVDYLVDYRTTPFELAPPALDPLAADFKRPRELAGLSPQERQQLRQKQRRADRRTFEEVRAWWLERMRVTPRPFEEKMTLFWHGHFTSGMREVRRSVFLYEQNELLRRLALGNFRDLLLQISKDRAMLVYLDGVRNKKRQPNENYARELLELFSLGEGNYREADIKAAARAFTGWSLDTDGFKFRRFLHDYGRKTFLGTSGNLGGEDIIDIILKQRACSEFLADELCRFFVCPDPSPHLVRGLAAVIRSENYELKPVMRRLFMSRAFYHSAHVGSLIKSPTELLVGAARQFNLPLNNLVVAERALKQMGQELMQPPNVKGWDGDEQWINTATLFNRYNVVVALINGAGERLPRFRRDRASNDEAVAVPRSRRASMTMKETLEPQSRLRPRGRQPQYDPMPTIRHRNLETAEQILDFYADFLLADKLASRKRAHLLHYLRGADGTFSLKDKDAPNRVRTMVALLCSTPEYQFN